jgi:hypothetical protein
MLDNKMFKKLRLENFNWSCRIMVDHRLRWQRVMWMDGWKPGLKECIAQFKKMIVINMTEKYECILSCWAEYIYMYK